MASGRECDLAAKDTHDGGSGYPASQLVISSASFLGTSSAKSRGCSGEITLILPMAGQGAGQHWSSQRVDNSHLSP